MDTMRLDLNLLLTLEALLAEQNVTKAAARLHLSQPAVSAQLNRLREMFDDPLLIPARRGMTPTNKALELLIPLRESLEKLRQTLYSHQDFYPERANLTVTIACTDYIQAAVVMPLVLALRQKAPGVRIAVGVGSAYDLYLTRTIKNATVVRASMGGGKAMIDMFVNDKLEVAAGVKQPLLTYAKDHPEVRVMDGAFMEIQQAMATPKGRLDGAAYLRTFVEEMKASGFVADAIKRSNQQAAVAPPAAK